MHCIYIECIYDTLYIVYRYIFIYIYIDIIPLSFRYLSIEFNMITLL